MSARNQVYNSLRFQGRDRAKRHTENNNVVARHQGNWNILHQIVLSKARFLYLGQGNQIVINIVNLALI